MEAVTILLPCYEVIMDKRRQKNMLRILRDWEEKPDMAATVGKSETSSAITVSQSYAHSASSRPNRRQDELYTRQSLEKCLAEDSSALLHFAASREFTGENIIFLNHIRDWKAAWDRVQSSETYYNWERDRSQRRLQLFKIAVEIYAAYVDIDTAEFPINIESQIYLSLRGFFGEAAKYLDRPVSKNTTMPFMDRDRENHIVVHDFNIESSSYSYDKTQFASQRLPSTSSSSGVRDIKTPFASDDTRSFFHQGSNDELAQARNGTLPIGLWVPDDVFVPADFGARSFDEAEKSIKYLVFTNTWPKFVDANRRDRRDGRIGWTA